MNLDLKTNAEEIQRELDFFLGEVLIYFLNKRSSKLGRNNLVFCF
jgi:hypothetical protein